MSSAVALTVPAEYGYVVLSAILSAFVGTWHGAQVGSYRKAAKVPFPNAYASASEAKDDRAKYLFNCAQRSHANFLEHQPAFLTGLLIGGLKYPIVSAGLGVAWCVARVMYTLGYTSDRPNGSGRRIGTWFYIPEFGLLICSGLMGWSLLAGQ